MSEVKTSANVRGPIPGLDKIEILFVLYSGAHNTVNAFNHTPNFVFFVFVLVGIVSVELMIHTVYKSWKGGRLVGAMRTAGLWSGGLAMFYATAGILAQAQTAGGADWVGFYHAWILPTSSPVMFVCAFAIQAIDPILKKELDLAEYEVEVHVETAREVLDKKKLELENRSNIRRLKSYVQGMRLDSFWKEAGSRRVKATLRRGARKTMPQILKDIGVPVERSNPSKFSFLSAGYSDDDLRLLNASREESKEETPGK